MTNLLLFLAETAESSEETVQLSGAALVIYDIFVYSLTVFMIVLTVMSITRRNKNDVSFNKAAIAFNMELKNLEAKIQNKTKKNRINYNFSKMHSTITSLNLVLSDLQAKSNLVETTEAIDLAAKAEKKLSRFILKNYFKSQDERNKFIMDLYQDLKQLSEKLDFISNYIDG